MIREGRPLTLAIACAFLIYAPMALAQRGRAPAAPAPPAPSAEVRVQDTQELTLSVGENRTIPATDTRNYSEGTPGIVDVKLTSDSSQFVIVGLKPGSTSLLLIKKDGSEVNWIISVFSRSPQLVEKEVTDLLRGYTGVRLRRVGARFFIEGGVSTEGDLQRIKQIASLYAGQVESLVAQGSVGIGGTANVRVDVFFVQYDKSSGYQVGVNYPAEWGGAAVQSTVGYDFVARSPTATASIVNQPLPALDIASQHGWAKVLKQATVITTNGIEATVANGGEQNFTVAAGLTGTIRPITFGTIVNVLPRFDPDSGDLEVKVDADISDLTAPGTGTTIPGRDTAKLTTIVHMKLGQSLVLAGIHMRSQTHTVSGIPLLSDIPVLGVLFGTHGDQEDEREGAIFVVPSVVDAAAVPTYDMIRDAMKQYGDYGGDIRAMKSFGHRPSVPVPASSARPSPPPGS